MTPTELLKQLVRESGAIVTTAECSAMEIADARATLRMAVDDDGIGYIRRSPDWLYRHKTCVQPDSQNGALCDGGTQSAELKTKNVIEAQEWDALVMKTYGRPYKLQQQDGGRGRGTETIEVPSEASDYERESVPEEVNHEEMGVSFKAWLARDPKKKLPDQNADYQLELWWERNCYPDLQMVANDLHAKGLLDAGRHTILIDW